MIVDEHHKNRLRASQRTSASQVSSFTLCQRKWFNEQILNLRSPPTAAQARGTAVHSVMEKYFKDKELPTTGEWSQLVSAGAKYLPDPKVVNSMVEHKFEFPTYPEGPLWIGVIDLMIETPDKGVDIIDHKTCNDFRWAKTPAELATDTQMVSYSHYIYNKLEPAEISVAHLYLRTKEPPRAQLVKTAVTSKSVAEEWAKRLPVVKEMVKVASECEKAEDLPPNKDACGMFGGCPFRMKCGFSALSNIVNEGATVGSSLSDRLKEKLKVAAEGQVAPTVQQPAVAVGILPPDAPSRVSTSDEVAAANPPAIVKRGRPRIVKQDPDEVIGGPLAERSPPNLEILASKGFTTDEVAKLIATEGVDDAIAGKITPGCFRQPPPIPTKRPLSEKVVKLSEELKKEMAKVETFLFVDCLPMSGMVPVLLESWIAPITAKLHQDLGKDWQTLDYGKGPGLLRDAVRSQLGTLPEALVLNSRSAASIALMEILVPAVKLVVKSCVQ